MIIIFEFPNGKNVNRKMENDGFLHLHMYVSEGNRHIHCKHN